MIKSYRLYIYNRNELIYNPIQAVIYTILKEHKCFCINHDNENNIIECLFSNIEDRYEAFKELQVNNINCKLDPLTKLLEEKEIKE